MRIYPPARLKTEASGKAGKAGTGRKGFTSEKKYFRILLKSASEGCAFYTVEKIPSAGRNINMERRMKAAPL